MQTDCRLVDAALDSRNRQIPENLRRHLEECARCQVLHGWLTTLDPVEVPSQAMDQIAARLATSHFSIKPIPSVAVSTVQLILCFLTLAVGNVALMGTVGIAQMGWIALLCMSALFLTGLGLFSTSLSLQMRPGSRWPFSPNAVVAACPVGVLAGMALLFPWSTSKSFVADGWPCLVTGLGVAIPGALVLLLIIRRGAPVSAGTLGATLGATAGLLGVTVLQLRCPHQEAAHLVVWHGAVLLAAAMAGTGLAVIAARIPHNRP